MGAGQHGRHAHSASPEMYSSQGASHGFRGYGDQGAGGGYGGGDFRSHSDGYMYEGGSKYGNETYGAGMDSGSRYGNGQSSGSYKGNMKFLLQPV